MSNPSPRSTVPSPRTTPSWSPAPPLPSYWLSDDISTCDVHKRILFIYRDMLVYGENIHDLLIICFPLGGGSHDLRLAAVYTPKSQLTLSTLSNSHVLHVHKILPSIQNHTLPREHIIKLLRLKPIYFAPQPPFLHTISQNQQLQPDMSPHYNHMLLCHH